MLYNNNNRNKNCIYHCTWIQVGKVISRENQRHYGATFCLYDSLKCDCSMNATDRDAIRKRNNK